MPKPPPRPPGGYSREPEPFYLQELPDPTQHLREDQKSWPLVSTEKPPRTVPTDADTDAGTTTPEDAR